MLNVFAETRGLPGNKLKMRMNQVGFVELFIFTSVKTLRMGTGKMPPIATGEGSLYDMSLINRRLTLTGIIE